MIHRHRTAGEKRHPQISTDGRGDYERQTVNPMPAKEFLDLARLACSTRIALVLAIDCRRRHDAIVPIRQVLRHAFAAFSHNTHGMEKQDCWICRIPESRKARDMPL